MDLTKWTLIPCAVCGHSILKKDISVVQHDDIDFTTLQNVFLPKETLPTTYNFNVYQGAILCPQGLHNQECLGPVDMCHKCSSALVDNKQQPKDALANWHYTGLDELPNEIHDAFNSASIFDLMLVSHSRATRITQLYSNKKNAPNYGQDSSQSQRYDRGNVSVIPQDSLAVRPLLPPDRVEIQTAMAALFCGGQEKPSAENIKKLSPVLVSKNRVQTMLDFLMSKNIWYQESGTVFSPENLADLYSQDDEHNKQAFPKAADLCWLPTDESDQVEGGNANYTDRNEYVRSDDNSDVALDAVGYTAGDRSPQNYRIMKASALAWCLSREKYIKMQGGLKLLSDRDPTMLTYLFPHLNPWG